MHARLADEPTHARARAQAARPVVPDGELVGHEGSPSGSGRRRSCRRPGSGRVVGQGGGAGGGAGGGERADERGGQRGVGRALRDGVEPQPDVARGPGGRVADRDAHDVVARAELTRDLARDAPEVSTTASTAPARHAATTSGASVCVTVR